ncbi:MAG: hypothetical protein ACRDZ8_15080 [Acidimicrobiales bacterium]
MALVDDALPAGVVEETVDDDVLLGDVVVVPLPMVVLWVELHPTTRRRAAGRQRRHRNQVIVALDRPEARQVPRSLVERLVRPGAGLAPPGRASPVRFVR